MSSILIVEDSVEVQVLLKRALSGLASELSIASSAQEAREKLAAGTFTLVLLDISLPDQDGFEVFAEMQASARLKTIPVVFLTGKDDVSAKVAAFAMGADDYVMKPFNAIELRARIEAKLKRATVQTETSQILCKGDLHLDASVQRAYTITSGERRAIHLTPREFKLLFHLAKNEERIFSRTQLLDAVWGGSSDVFDRTVDTHISGVRKKLGELGSYIEAITGAGYRFSTCRKAAGLKKSA
jgi:two-component system, OmpR family, phosphate regulon response regulator PhoB